MNNKKIFSLLTFSLIGICLVGLTNLQAVGARKTPTPPPIRKEVKKEKPIPPASRIKKPIPPTPRYEEGEVGELRRPAPPFMKEEEAGIIEYFKTGISPSEQLERAAKQQPESTQENKEEEFDEEEFEELSETN